MTDIPLNNDRVIEIEDFDFPLLSISFDFFPFQSE